MKKLQEVKIRKLRFATGVTILDKVRNEYIKERLGFPDIQPKIKDDKICWLGHIVGRSEDHITNKIRQFKVCRKTKK